MTSGEVRPDLKARPHRPKRYPRCRGLQISRWYFGAHEYCLANDRTTGFERTRLLIIDDWGPEPLTAEQRRDLLEIADDRCDKARC
jgi:hypothetical protein